MKERPILFSGPMIRAILEGRKTVTRRVVKGLSADDLSHFTEPALMLYENGGLCVYEAEYPEEGSMDLDIRCPYGAPGDRLWVRETWHSEGGLGLVRYRASGDALHELKRWKPSIHMPRWASRITLDVAGVRVERLHEITHEEAEAEGCVPRIKNGSRILAFSMLWDEINGAGAWDANPWVWVVEFRRVA